MQCTICNDQNADRYSIKGGMIADLCPKHAIKYGAVPVKPATGKCPNCHMFGKCCNTKEV